MVPRKGNSGENEAEDLMPFENGDQESDYSAHVATVSWTDGTIKRALWRRTSGKTPTLRWEMGDQWGVIDIGSGRLDLNERLKTANGN